MRTLQRLLLAALALAGFASVAQAQFTPPVLRYQWGSYGTGAGFFSEPYDLATSPAGEVFVTDLGNHRIQVFDRSGTFLRQWGSQGPGNGQFVFPTGIAYGPDGNVYVTDNGHDRVQVFTPAGAFVTQWGSVGTAPGQFRSPWGIDVDSDGLVYVSDPENARVSVFTPLGSLVRTINVGSYMANNLALDHHGHFWLADAENHRIVEYTTAGVAVVSLTWLGTGYGYLDTPSGIAIDPSGRVHVFDNTSHFVDVFSDTGVFLAQWGGETAFPAYYRGMEFDGDGNLYLATPELDHVQVYVQDAPVPTHPVTWGALKAAYR